MSRTLPLPNGVTTTNPTTYIAAWEKFAQPVCNLLGGELLSYDPGVQILVAGKGSITLPKWVVEIINARLAHE